MSGVSIYDPLNICDTLQSSGRDYLFWSLERLQAHNQCLNLERQPYSTRLLIEMLLRSCSQGVLPVEELGGIMGTVLTGSGGQTVPFFPARVLMQDFTAVPAIVDIAAMRETVKRLGGEPDIVNPVIPVDVVVDHSIQVHKAGCAEALDYNTDKEYESNMERYTLLRWAERALKGVRVFPPGTGIVHQINLEYLASVARTDKWQDISIVYPDSVCGTDSHTTMVNALGIMGWGVGGIEAEAAMLGRPLAMTAPEIIGVKLVGTPAAGVTTTDIVLMITERLRQEEIVGCFIEFCGEGMGHLSLPDRATIANMAPEYGATLAYFPVDDEVVRYLRSTGRQEEAVRLAADYYRAQGLFRHKSDPIPCYERMIEIDLGQSAPCLAGPARPQDRILIRDLPKSLRAAVWAKDCGSVSREYAGARPIEVDLDHEIATLTDGSILIAAITSCTNTSNPSVMIAAGLLARRAVSRGLRVPGYVKTSLSPGSRVVSDYLHAAGLTADLEKLGFHVSGYGCMTCSGSSGPVDEKIADAVSRAGLVTCAVLSGNRNFEGRINPLVQANYLASPPLVIAYAIAGTVAVDLDQEPLGYDREGYPVYLNEIWPAQDEISRIMQDSLCPDDYRKRYGDGLITDARWASIQAPEGNLFQWQDGSTYIARPPFMDAIAEPLTEGGPTIEARVLALLGDSITTDHISPGGAIAPANPAGQYLSEQGVRPDAFNVFGSRRGNHEVMVRGAFSNIHLRNRLVPETEGGYSLYQPTGEILTIYEAAMRYRADGTPLLIIAGREYGSGSSRDWASKAPALLGVKAVIAEGFERIHRANLVHMGILPLEFLPGQGWESLGLSGTERYEWESMAAVYPGQEILVKASTEDGKVLAAFAVKVRIDTESELDSYRAGGILPLVVRQLLTRSPASLQAIEG
ncbi:aconitate hydratase AcnA [Paenibacillus sambharensis]|uniref:Aconitate hydratase n=1 Tax=Paenibacillus sambharensis TaxID=1803190 RepID=A0A2W1LCB7_9BACL|nr:aconitate hydratase AcnA [Paenibacillus sambharensis]PZD96796.1 aconitate hydratase AcnA [Paenibacillus sambharensis]